jgi:signal transduction histidine kinase
MLQELLTTKSAIAKKLLFYFLLVSLLPLSIFAYLGYRNAINIIKVEVTNSLIAIADSKARMIETYIKEKEKDVSALANTPTIIRAMDKFSVVFNENGLDSPEYSALDKEFRPFLTYYQESFRYYDLFLISCEGDVVFSVKKEDDFGTNVKTGSYKKSELAKVFNRTHTTVKTEISDFKYYAPSNGPAAFIATPVLKEGDVRGVVVFQINNEETYELMRDYTGLGKTGETLIGSKIGKEAVFISPLRHDPQAAFRRKAVIGSKEALPIQEAVQGREGLGLSTDYRNEEVLAVWRYLPLPRWGMVVKIDTKEAFAPVVKMRNWSLIIGIITVAGVIVLVLFVSKSISDPIMALHKGAEIVGGGNLDHKIGITSKDEIGQLSRAFDAMTENLKKITASRNELNKIMLELERSNKDLQQFAYVASHDLQEPLRTVASFTQLLERRYEDKLDSKAKEFMHFTVDAALRMQRLINDLLAYSRVGDRNNSFEPADCNSLLAQAISGLSVAIDESHAIITHDNLPIIMLDSLEITQLFQNMISNSIKFRSEQIPRIHVSARQKDHEWIFSVQDNCIGIDPKYKDRILKIFQRLHSRDEYAGTGIGLAICKKIVERHEGRLWVESELGKGATFYFTLSAKEIENYD